MKQITVLTMLVLAGCINMPLNQEEATHEIRKFKGHPVSDLVSRLGDKPVERNGHERLEFKQAGNRYNWRFTSVIGYGTKIYCWVEAVTDDSKIIRDTYIDGNVGGCSWVAKRAGNMR